MDRDLGAVRSVPIESQADRRRAQLVRAAALLIESDGIESLRMAEVAKIAGCTRQVVHGYFAKREDLLRSVLVEFDRVLHEKLAPLGNLAMDPGTFSADQLAAWSERVARGAWDLIDDVGLAGLILMASPDASPAVKRHTKELRQPLVERWMGYIEPVVPTKLDAEMIVELWITTFHRLALKWRAGELTREQGTELMMRYCESILQAFAQPALHASTA